MEEDVHQSGRISWLRGELSTVGLPGTTAKYALLEIAFEGQLFAGAIVDDDSSMGSLISSWGGRMRQGNELKAQAAMVHNPGKGEKWRRERRRGRFNRFWAPQQAPDQVGKGPGGSSHVAPARGTPMTRPCEPDRWDP